MPLIKISCCSGVPKSRNIKTWKLPTIQLSFCDHCAGPGPFRQMLTNNRHCQGGAILSAIFFRQGKAQMSGSVGTAAHFAQQFLPFMAGLAIIVPIGASIFAPVVKNRILSSRSSSSLISRAIKASSAARYVLISSGISKSMVSPTARRTRATVNRALHYVCIDIDNGHCAHV